MKFLHYRWVQNQHLMWYSVCQFLKNFITDLLDELKDVFREEDIRMIGITRPLTDWTGLAMKIKDRTLPIVYALEKSTFADNCKKVCRSVKSVEEDEIQSQFYVFLKRLEIVTKAYTNKNFDKKDPKN